MPQEVVVLKLFGWNKPLKVVVLIFDQIHIMCDNTNVINLSKNIIQQQKHIEIRHHFLRDHVQKWDISLNFVSTEKQFADIFTTPLSEEQFTKIRHELGTMNIAQ